MTNPSEVSPLCALLTTLAQPSGLKLNLADARLPTCQSSAPETAVGPRASLDHLSHGHNECVCISGLLNRVNRVSRVAV